MQLVMPRAVAVKTENYTTCSLTRRLLLWDSRNLVKNVDMGFRVSVAWTVLAGTPDVLILKTSVTNSNME